MSDLAFGSRWVVGYRGFLLVILPTPFEPARGQSTSLDRGGGDSRSESTSLHTCGFGAVEP